jgi:hypothetical protein
MYKYRYLLLFTALVGLLLLLIFLFPYLWRGIVFAILCSFFAELIAILLSELGLFLYTRLNFLHIDDWLSKSRLLGLIFVSVHILVAIIFAMMFWSNIQ